MLRGLEALGAGEEAEGTVPFPLGYLPCPLTSLLSKASKTLLPSKKSSQVERTECAQGWPSPAFSAFGTSRSFHSPAPSLALTFNESTLV